MGIDVQGLEELANQFGLSSQELATLASQHSSSAELLQACLLSGKVQESAYYPWAMETFQLPMVKPAFFEIPTDLVFWESVKDLYAWRKDLLPLAEWQGVLMIGCLAPPGHFRLNHPHRFVLASAKQLQQLWLSLQPRAHAAPAVHAASATQSFEAQSSEPQNSKVQNFDAPEGLSLPNLSISNEEPSDLQDDDAEMTALELDAPEGLTGNGFKGPFESEPQSDDLAHASAESVEAPDGIQTGLHEIDLDFSSLIETSTSDTTTLPVHEAATATLAAASDRKLGESDLSEMTLSKAPSASGKTNVIPLMSEASPSVLESTSTSSTPMPPPPPPTSPPRVTSTASRPTIETASAKPASSENAPLNTKTTSSTASAVVSQNAMARPLGEAGTYDQLGENALAHILKTYEHGMVLLFQGGVLRPWKWTELLFSTKGNSPDEIPLEDPSIFRIVFRTCLPYHGYVAPCPINSAFFNAFHRGSVPHHVTLTPIMIQGQIAGMLMGLTNSEINYKQSLRQLEQLTKEFAIQLESLRSSAAAA